MNKFFSWITYVWVNIIETILRLFPFPTKTGLRIIGNPDENSPVLLTCNFRLTVRRVLRSLKDIDCYLLIANTKGINVWCAATGGHLNNHSVISLIKTSGIEEKVNHKKIVLPQLAAAGVETKIIKKKTAWDVLWGPVDIKDIKEFLDNNYAKTEKMRKIKFPVVQRLEMAVLWAFPLSIVLTIIWVFFYTDELLALWIQVWSISIFTFLSYPLYEPVLQLEKKQNRHSFFGWSKLLLLLFISSFALLGVVIYTMIILEFEPWIFGRWCIFSFIVSLIVVMDLAGTTPNFKSDTHEDRIFSVNLDVDKCKGAGICFKVCPRNCFDFDEEKKIAVFKRIYDCVQCGACVVQCPFDAIHFENKEGEILSPENVRKFKLNLSGKRVERSKETKV